MYRDIRFSVYAWQNQLLLDGTCMLEASQVVLVVKNLPSNARDTRDADSIPWVRKIPWRRAWQLTPVFLPGESHGQRSLACYGPYGPKELDTTEATQHSRIHILQILSAEAHSILWLWLYCFLYSFGLPSDNYSLFFFNYFIFNVPRTFHSQILYRTMNLLTSLA